MAGFALALPQLPEEPSSLLSLEHSSSIKTLSTACEPSKRGVKGTYHGLIGDVRDFERRECGCGHGCTCPVVKIAEIGLSEPNGNKSSAPEPYVAVSKTVPDLASLSMCSIVWTTNCQCRTKIQYADYD